MQSSPCILFFDELDALAPKRGSSHGHGDKVVNQLLTEMDGVSERGNLFIVGATNRPDVLDPAILRQGRLGQHVYIPLPDLEARRSILRASLRKTPYEPNVDVDKLADDCVGYSGADLASLCSMAAKILVRERVNEMKARARAGGEEQKGEAAEKPKLGSLVIPHWCFEIAKNASAPSITPMKLQEYAAYASNLQAELGKASVGITAGEARDDETYRKVAADAGNDDDDEGLYD